MSLINTLWTGLGINVAKTITKSTLVDSLVESNSDLTVNQAKAFIEDFFEAISSVVEKESDLNLSGFGSFSVKAKSSRLGRNPKTGEEHIIDSRNVVSFKASTSFKEKLSTSHLNLS